MMTQDDNTVRDHYYLWKVQQITDVVGFADLTNAELELLAALLEPTHTRYLDELDAASAVRPVAPVLRLVRDNPIDEWAAK
jgi:hypothetical protein